MSTAIEKVIQADVKNVHVSEHNTRQPTLKEVTASGLLESILSQGQLTPALARPHPTIKNAYELAAGACRHTACTALKIRLKLIVREMTDSELLDAILTENLQRTDPDPEAEADLIARAEIGDTCFAVDDQTVAKTDGSESRSAAGIIRDVDAQGVWVEI